MAQTVVVKIGTSSISNDRGEVALEVIERLSAQISKLRSEGNRVIVVSSGAVAAGLQVLGMSRPNDVLTKQAVSAVGQPRLMTAWINGLRAYDIVAAQVLLTPHDFFDRTQYLHTRNTFGRLLDLGVVPVVNENDAIADDELRFGDNDRIAALVSHLVSADLLVLLTDMNGLYTDDPRRNPLARLVTSLAAVTPEIEALAGGTGTSGGSGGMRSKIRAAKMASLSGVRAVIANAMAENVLVDAASRAPVGTEVLAQERGLSARKLWIGFAVDVEGQIEVDAGARKALIERNVSLLPAGAIAVHGSFADNAAVEIVNDGHVVARGLIRVDSTTAAASIGKRSSELPEDFPGVLVHRDDLVVLVRA